MGNPNRIEKLLARMEKAVDKEFYPVMQLGGAFLTFMIATLIVFSPGVKAPEQEPKIISNSGQTQITAPKGNAEQPPAKQVVKPENKAVMNENSAKYRQFRRIRPPVAKPDSGAMKQQRILKY